MGFDVFVYARSEKNSLPLGQYSFRAKRIHCYFKSGFLKFGEFNIKLLLKLLFKKTDYILANDLDALVPAFIASKIRNKKLFYDTHEYYTGVPELKNAPFKKSVWKFFENRIFPKLETIYTVNDSVKRLYDTEYKKNLAVIRNVPVRTVVKPIEKPLHWKNRTVLLMQGIGIHPGRGGIELLEMMKFMPDEYLLVYIGWGTQWEEILQKRTAWSLQHKVEMIPKMPPEQLKQYTPHADLGFSLDGFDNDNYLYNLPNKLFDYIQAGVPVVATAIPEVLKIIEHYHCGICLFSNEPEKMAEAVIKLYHNKEYYQTLKNNARIAAQELCWDIEKIKLQDIYKPYL
ncbi:hypothetical protein A8C56_08550 [Niabella ginsenosidivorans]|uniref:Glycosyl transferase family 1 domain-containing protein n=2 Tax=Niabella ginsenosidivorans TaxID=1176587 RepID=A0A1A9I2V0_9BACT|nr:hypothetical protein A8C56_08550 [Niabella ginsenosidivorans]